jgi:hypothetical protein
MQSQHINPEIMNHPPNSTEAAIPNNRIRKYSLSPALILNPADNLPSQQANIANLHQHPSNFNELVYEFPNGNFMMPNNITMQPVTANPIQLI